MAMEASRNPSKVRIFHFFSIYVSICVCLCLNKFVMYTSNEMVVSGVCRTVLFFAFFMWAFLQYSFLIYWKIGKLLCSLRLFGCWKSTNGDMNLTQLPDKWQAYKLVLFKSFILSGLLPFASKVEFKWPTNGLNWLSNIHLAVYVIVIILCLVSYMVQWACDN